MADRIEDGGPAWGALEHAARIADLAEVRAGKMALGDARKRADSRRRQAGLNVLEAASAIYKFSCERRRQEIRARQIGLSVGSAG